MRTKTFPRFSKHTEAVTVKRCPVKKGVLKNFDSTCVGVFFNKVAGLKTYRLQHRCLLSNLQNFSELLFRAISRTTASKHRNSLLETFYRSCCSALINAVIKCSFSAAVSEIAFRKFTKNCTPSQVYIFQIISQQLQNSNIEKCIWRKM